MESNFLEIVNDNGILTIIINRPSRNNAINELMMKEITSALNEAAEDDNVELVVLTGAGAYYCSGNDMKASDTLGDNMFDMVKKRIEIGKEFVASFINFPKLLIAIVNGPAIGVAMTTLGLCDLVFSSTEAFFWTPFATLGLCAEGCSSYVFPKIMGYAKANNVLQFGKKLSATEAKEYNLVSDIYKSEELQTILWPKLRQMKNTLSKQSLLANKRLIRKWDKKILHEVNEAEWTELESRLISEDFMIAIQKFMDRSSKTENKL